MKRNSFVDYLCSLQKNNNRGALAQLRRGLGKEPGAVPSMYPYVIPWVHERTPRLEKIYFIIAALYASHPNNCEGVGNLGKSLKRLASHSNQVAVERRFISLLNSHVDEIHKHLRHTISLLKSDNIPIDYSQLFKDLRYWDNDNKITQRRWARAFWQASEAEDTTTNEGVE